MYNNLMTKCNMQNTLRLLLRPRQIKCLQAQVIQKVSTLQRTTEIGGILKSHMQEANCAAINWQAVQHKLCSTNVDNEVAAEEVASSEDIDQVEHGTAMIYLKRLLYEESDELIRRLNKCEDFQELFDVLSTHKDVLNHQHLVQSVILLWSMSRNSVQLASDVLSDGRFDDLLHALHAHINNMNCDELSISFMYLHKFGVAHTHLTMSDLLLKSLEMVKNEAKPIPLTALSRLIVTINSSHCYHTTSVCQHFPPHILSHIESCRSAEEARLLAICLLNLHQLSSTHLLDAYKERVAVLLANGCIDRSNTKCLHKMLYMLNMPLWAVRNTRLMRQLMLMLQPSIAEMGELELKSVNKIFHSQLEPAGITEKLKETAAHLLNLAATPERLACYLLFAERQKHESLQKIFRSMLADERCWQQPKAASTFFVILRGLKISDIQLCDDYWAGVLRQLESNPHEHKTLRFLHHCHRYMNFNNNLGGTYRHLAVERKLSELSMHMIEHNVAGFIPSKFARLAAFVLAYGHTTYGHTKFPNIVVSKVISMAEQFSIVDCLHLSRGLQIALEMRFRNYNPPPLTSQLATMENVFAECTQRHLQSKERLTPVEINAIVRSLNNRRASKRSPIYHEALSKYKNIDYSALTSRTIRDMAYNFNTSNYIIPEVLDAMFEYIEQNFEHVIGDTVAKVLTCAYSLGYTPNSWQVLEKAAHALMRDFDQMSALSLVQASLALCYYKAIPEPLIAKVFCVDFIQRVEEEIKMCYSKATYPELVLNLVMQLNRTVCLDFPEANVPWFQQNYLESHLSRKPFKRTRFNEDVKKFLKSLLKNENYFRCNHVTPYGYRIDFVIHFDKDKNPIAAPVETTMLDRITKVAILLLKLDSFCENDLTTMRGHESLRMKHLEMMGYKVLHINVNDWNSKYMNVPGAKTKYLKGLLQITN